jgi:hypothetical protein
MDELVRLLAEYEGPQPPEISESAIIANHPRPACYQEVARELVAVKTLIEWIGSQIGLAPTNLPQQGFSGADDFSSYRVQEIRANYWADRLDQLVELRGAAYGKVVGLQNLKGEVIYLRFSQVNADVADLGLRIVSRLSKVAREIIPAKTGDLVKFEDQTWRIVHIALLSRSARTRIKDFTGGLFESLPSQTLGGYELPVSLLEDSIYEWVGSLWRKIAEQQGANRKTFSCREVAIAFKDASVSTWKALVGASLIHKYFGQGTVKDVWHDRFRSGGTTITIQFADREAQFQPGNFISDYFLNISFPEEMTPLLLGKNVAQQNTDSSLLGKEAITVASESPDNPMAPRDMISKPSTLPLMQGAEAEANILAGEPEKPSLGPADNSPTMESGLSSTFYTRTTRFQEESIRKLHGGLLIVEGIAGSGKTSVALGRVKALHDSRFGTEDGTTDGFFDNRKEFVGFVRSPQLIEFLRQTIDDLNLSGMSVIEFDSIRWDLARHHASLLGLKTGSKSSGKYRRVAPAARGAFEGSMEWVQRLTSVISDIYIQHAREVLLELKASPCPVDERELSFLSDLGRSINVPVSAIWSELESGASHEIDKALRDLSHIHDGRLLKTGLVTQMIHLYGRCCRWVSHDYQWHFSPPPSTKISIRPQGRGITDKLWDPSRYPRSEDKDALKKLQEHFVGTLQTCLLLGDTSKSRLDVTGFYHIALDTIKKSELYSAEKIQRISQRLASASLTPNDITILLAVVSLLIRGYRPDRKADYKGINRALKPAEHLIYKTVFIDEVQDFTEAEVFLMSSLADDERSAITAVGDFCQQLYPGTVSKLKNCFPFSRDAELTPITLDENKRQSPLLVSYSANVREFALGNLATPPRPATKGKTLWAEQVAINDLPFRIGELIGETDIEKSVAVICPNADLAQMLARDSKDYVEEHFRFVSASLDSKDLMKKRYCHFTDPRPTKGLEFDFVIIAYFNKFDVNNAIDRNAIYVAVSRAKERLVILSSD